MDVQTIVVGKKRLVVLEESEYKRLCSREQSSASKGTKRGRLRMPRGPQWPPADANGDYPAAMTLLVMIARKTIQRRQAAGLSQVELAKRAGIRPETLNRIEQGKNAPTVTTVEKIDRVLKKAGV